MPIIRASLGLAALLLSAPAFAQNPASAGGPPPGVRDDGGDRLMIGIGLGASTDYEGSDDYQLQPGGLFQGRVSGIEFQVRGPGLYTDFVPDKPGAKTRLAFGPAVQVRLDRTGEIKDLRVAALGDRETAVELGFTAGISKQGVLIPPASLNFDVTFLHDVAGAHKSYLVTPSLSLNSPVSRSSFARLGVSADFVGKGYAATYFDVAPGNVLAPYATNGGGLKSLGTSLLYTHDLGGAPRKGWALFGLANYKRLVGKFADSPIVSEAGSASQVFAVAGVSYSF
jgi:outer membrane scaffolding protein for murein synthesis (MipA/OmpV family)